MRRVQKIAITELLKDCVADFIDMDVQGSELEIIVAARELLGARVKRVHIGTHSEKVENGLRALFTELTWTNLHDYSLQGKRETPYGMIDFGDGVQTWVNPIFVT